MKLMRLAMCVAIFAVVGGKAVAEESVDVSALQAQLAQQEARLYDIQAKMSGACEDDAVIADGLTSLRKNAVVTLGGTVNTRYFVRNGKIQTKSDFPVAANPAVPSPGAIQNWDPDARFQTVAKGRARDLKIADAKLEAKIDVNDNFDAYFKLDMQSSSNGQSDNAEQYWIRWKNIACSGFGVLVGRDGLKYGMGPSVGVLDSWSAPDGDGVIGDALGGALGDLFGNLGTNEWGSIGLLPTHTGWDFGRVTQITPYWENQDGSFKAELMLAQSYDGFDGQTRWYQDPVNNAWHSRSINDGIGVVSGRITWKPIEDLKIVASAMNKYAKSKWNYAFNGGVATVPDNFKKNNFAASIGFEYNPGFLCNRLTVWGYYQHGWNEGWYKDNDTNLFNAGLKYAFNDNFYAFGQFDYFKGDHGGAVDVINYQGGLAGNDVNKVKATGYAYYAGLGYTLPYGVKFETGYRYDRINWKADGAKVLKATSNTFYAHLGFDF